MQATSARRAKTALDLAGRSHRIAVIGAGPAGFYAASRLLALRGTENTHVHLFELNPVPFGLSRFGVAPDHPEVKNCEHKFESTAQDPRFSFFGNVQITGDSDLPPTTSLAAQIPLSTLRDHYDAVILTYGAALDRLLDVPGEATLSNVLSARSFVNWYNGHPYHAAPLASLLDLSKLEHVTVVGQGNVAMDVARILLKPVDELRETDMPEYALAELSRSKVRRVEIVGRRGPLQLACTTKELREMMTLEGVAFEMDQSLLAGAEAELAVAPGMAQARMRKRAMALLHGGSKTPLLEASKSWSFEFLKSPTSFLPSAQDSTAVGTVEYDVNELVAPPTELASDPASLRARRTGGKVVTHTDMVLKSVGYRSIGLAGLPFDERTSTIRNEGGRVVNEDGTLVEGMYTSGWLARGPNGVIATTMFDAFSTADIVAADLAASSGGRPPPRLDQLSTKKLVSWSDWERIDKEERRRGSELGKPREKMTDVQELLAFVS